MSKVIKANYTDEATAGFTHRTAMEEAARCLLCYDAPCSKGCPAGTDPAKFIRSIRFRNVKGAAETIRENNILGGSCARVCPYDRLCEEACSRCGIDKPIQIGKLQRYAIEAEKLFDMQTLAPPEQQKPEKIACIGAGPASLACAAQLAKSGYKVTIIEREAAPGGLLTYGIVPSRLPQEVVEHDILQIKNLGVHFMLNTDAEDVDLEEYDAVFAGIGLWGGVIPRIEGAEKEGVYSALKFLKKTRIEADETDFGKRVVVVGGGDVAVDCAAAAKLGGAEDVKIIYRRTLEEAPGNMTEFQYALSLGIGITTGFAPEVIKGKGRVETIGFTGFKDEKSKLVLEADTVVFATGQRAERTDFAEKYFAGGDIVNGGRTVVEAVADGKAAAEEIIKFLENVPDEKASGEIQSQDFTNKNNSLTSDEKGDK